MEPRLYLLVHDVLGHERCGVVGGDLGGAIACDLLHRYPGIRGEAGVLQYGAAVRFDDFAAAGIDVVSIRAIGDGPTADYRHLQGATPDALACRTRYPGQAPAATSPEMYGHRLWASPGTFTADDADFMTEPFSTEERMRAGWACYQLMHGRPMSEPPILDRKVDVPTLILYGMDDQVIGPDFLHTCEVAFTNRTGPVVVPGAGHFLQWERADLVNPLVDRLLRRPACSPSAIGSGLILSASTLMYRVLGGRRPTPAPAPATTARGTDAMPNTW